MSFTDACNEAYDLWDNDELDACSERVRDFFASPAFHDTTA
jgi:hypothetical protein